MSFLRVTNNAGSTLAAGITNTATSLTVAAGHGARFPTTNFHVTIGDEIVLCTTRSGDVFTIVRAREGTTATAHSAGASVELRVTAQIVRETQGAIDQLAVSIWHTRASAADNAWNSVAWSPERGLFVAVAGSGAGNRVMTSLQIRP